MKKKITLENKKVNVKVKLALLWVGLMFFYIYNDLLSFFQEGHVAQLVEGNLEGVVFTQPIMVGAAAIMAFPSLMILLSLTLKAKANRLANIIVGIFHLLVLASTQFVGEGEVWLYWRLNELFQASFLIIITLTAWKWPKAK